MPEGSNFSWQGLLMHQGDPRIAKSLPFFSLEPKFELPFRLSLSFDSDIVFGLFCILLMDIKMMKYII